MRGKDRNRHPEGLAIAMEFIAPWRSASGFYIIPPIGKYRIAEELVRFIRR
jgi:homocysteine S-methyltransferase